jgi:hypothetical protein
MARGSEGRGEPLQTAALRILNTDIGNGVDDDPG